MIYVDELVYWGSKGWWCHCWSDDSDEELHQFAARLGLKREWAQPKPHLPITLHYDLRPSKRALAVKLGANEVKLLEWLRQRREQSHD